MKRLLIVVLLFMAFAIPVLAQDTSKVLISKSELTPAQLKTAQSSSTVENVRPWVGLGREVGDAVNSSLSAVTEQTAKFADTPVGKFTMFIVAWKVLGDDIKGTFFALIVIFLGFPILVWSYRKHTNVSVLDKEILDAKGKVSERIYRAKNYDEQSSMEVAQLLHGLGALIILGSSALAFF